MKFPAFRWLVALGLQGLLLIGNQAQAPQAPEEILPVLYDLFNLEAPAVSVISVPALPKKRAQHLELEVAHIRKPAAAAEAPSALPFSMSGEQALSLGKALVLDGDHEGALPYLQEAAKRLPKSFEAQKELADCNFTLQHDDDAAAGYKEVVGQYALLRDEGTSSRSELAKLTPQFGEVQFNLGQIHLDQARYAEAVAVFTEALTIKPSDPDTLTGLGIALLKQGRSAEAIPYLKQVATLQSYSAAALYNLGEAYAGDGQWLLAAEAFEKSGRITTIYAGPYFNWACMLYNADRLEQAVDAYIEVKKRDLANVDAAVYLADALNRLGRRVQAKSYYVEVLKSRPKDINSLINLAYLKIKLGEFEEAERVYSTLLALEPRADAAANLAALQTRRNKFKTPGITLREIGLANPSNVEVQINLGAQLIVEGVYPEAVQVLQQAVRLKQDSAAAQFNLGLAQYKAGAHEKAVASNLSALQLKPEWAAAYNNLGLAYTALSRWDEAIKAFQEAIRIQPTYGGARYHLGHAYVQTGQKALANQQLESLKSLSEQLPGKLLYEIDHMDGSGNQVAAATPTPDNQVPTAIPTPAPTPLPTATPTATPTIVSDSPPSLPPVTTETPAKTDNQDDCPSPVYRPNDVTTMALIEVPQPLYTEEGRAKGVQGKVVLHFILCANGKVSDLSVVKELPFGLTQKAIEALKKATFQPATKDGKPVSVFVDKDIFFVLN